MGEGRETVENQGKSAISAGTTFQVVSAESRSDEARNFLLKNGEIGGLVNNASGSQLSYTPE